MSARGKTSAWPSVLTRGLAVSVFVALGLLPATPAMAQASAEEIITCGSAGCFLNGSRSGPSELGPNLRGAFLFEVEFPLGSLKTVPIWNELEQLLDNPYLVTLCSNLGLTIGPTSQTTGSPVAVVYPSYCSALVAGAPGSGLAAGPNGIVRGRPTFGVPLPPLLVHPLNYNPTNGEEMRLLNPGFPQTQWEVPDRLVQCSESPLPDQLVQNGKCDGTITVNSSAGLPTTTGPFDPNRWVWTYLSVPITPGAGRVSEAEIDYNAPVNPDDRSTCLITTEIVPAEGSTICGGDPGEPNYGGFGVLRADGYSTPAVPGGTLVSGTTISGIAGEITGLKLFDPFRGFINARDPVTGAGGLHKPSLRIPPWGTPSVPGYLVNTDANNVVPSNENDYVRNRTLAAVLGKSLFWDQQVGSDTVQACGSCHAHAGADNRTKNQMNPNDIQAGPLGADLFFEVGQSSPTLLGANHDLVASDFPIHKLFNPEIAGDPACTSPLVATLDSGVLENTPGSLDGAPHFAGPFSQTVCDKANIVNQRPDGTDQNDVASSMGVHFGMFRDIPTPGPGAFNLASNGNGVASLKPDLRRTATDLDPIPGFAGTDGSGHEFRRVEPRNTPTVFAAAINFDNFWDGRARHDFNGGSVFGPADPQKHVFVSGGVNLTATRQIIRFVSIASLATGPALSKFEMSFDGRNWAKIGKKLLQGTVGPSPTSVTPLANQLVAPTDGVLGPFSNQGGSTCIAMGRPTALGKPGLCTTYQELIKLAFYPALWNNASKHLNGCYTDGRTPTDLLTPNCPAGTFDDPFDHYVLSVANGVVNATNTNQFTHMEANFSLFFGLSIATWATLLLPDNTPFDQFLDANPDMFESAGETGEPGLVGPMPVCRDLAGPGTELHCFREVGNFKRDATFLDPNTDNCLFPHPGEGVITQTLVSLAPCKGTRTGGPDPLLGMDIFQGSNFSLKNPNFRAARCGECHAGGTLTDNTMPFTVKAQLGDFIGEFITAGNEALVEPLGRSRVITGFLLEDELNGNGQDAIERRIINQSIVPCPTGLISGGLAFPGGLDPVAPPPGYTDGHGFGLCEGAASAIFDNGVYNLGVTICEANQSAVTGRCDDIGRGANDAFGWPMSLAALMLKNVGGNNGAPCGTSGLSAGACATEPGNALVNFDPTLGGGGGLFEETAQDQTLNPGEEDEVVNPLLPPYLAPFANKIPVGDSMPELDEIHAGLNTFTDVAITEGFIDVLGPFNPAGVLNESMNNGDGPEMGTWPVVNRVGRFGSIKAPQLREVELTGPYFHNGGKLTLRQVVDFYVRGGDYPITNATHRDFNIIHLGIEKQSNLTEQEKVALVDFLLELTDDRVRFEQAPFDHPEAILPLDGRASENTVGRAAMLAGCVDTLPDGSSASKFGPGNKACAGGMFLDVPATGGTVGNGGFALPNFLGVTKDRGTDGISGFNCDPTTGPISHYCH